MKRVGLKFRRRFDEGKVERLRQARLWGLGSLILSILITILTTATAGAQQIVAPILYNQPDPVLGVSDLWLLTPDGSVNRQIPLSPQILVGADQPAWSRDGQLIAVTGAIPGTSSSTLVISNLAATQVLVPVGNNAPVTPFNIYKAFSPVFPDGSRYLAYASLQANYVDFGTINLTGPTQPVSPTMSFLPDPGGVYLGFRNNTEGVSGFGLDWSPVNPNLLVVSSSGLNNTCGVPISVTQLFLVQPVQNGLDQGVPLTNPPLICPGQTADSQPAFSPDGTQVAFVRVMQDQSQISGTPTTSLIDIIRIDGTNEHTVAQFPEELVTSISWSPDGTRLIFGRAQIVSGAVLPNYGNGIWVINSDGSGLTQLLTAPANQPAWSPVAIPLS